MSSRCQCRLSDPLDTILGAHKDPISSEKCWLDYIVRELSRVAAGKGRGQEAVWGAQCQPKWWKSACRHPWKNPTANPKDNKDTLNAKFECLVKHLRNEGKLPSELQEEIALWEKGCAPEVFLMTTFSSLLSWASNLHVELQMTEDKMRTTGITIQPRILDALLSCLSACMDKLNAMKKIENGDSGASSAKNNARCSDRKRPHDDSRSESEASQPKSKRFKLPAGDSPLSSPSSPSSSPPPPALSPCLSPLQCSPEQRTLVLVTLQKQLLEKKTGPTAAATLIAQQQPLHNMVPAANSKNASIIVAAPVDPVPPSVAISHSPDPASENEIMSSYSDFFSLELGDDSNFQISDFGDLLTKSPEICSESEMNTENNFTCQMVPIAPVGHSPVTFNPNYSVSNSDVFIPSEVSHLSSTATDGESPQGVLLVSNLHSGLEDIDCIEEELVCESGYSSDGSASLLSSLDSTSPKFSDLDLEAFLESLENQNIKATPELLEAK